MLQVFGVCKRHGPAPIRPSFFRPVVALGFGVQGGVGRRPGSKRAPFSALVLGSSGFLSSTDRFVIPVASADK